MKNKLYKMQSFTKQLKLAESNGVLDAIVAKYLAEQYCLVPGPQALQ
jgi:hypothetical protein